MTTKMIVNFLTVSESHKQTSFMRVAQCYSDKQTNEISVIALRAELCAIRRFGIRRFGLQWVVLIMGLSPKRRIPKRRVPQSSVRSAITNILFVCLSVKAIVQNRTNEYQLYKMQS